MIKTKRTPRKAGSGDKPSRTPPKPFAAKPGASARLETTAPSQTAAALSVYSMYGLGRPSELRSAATSAPPTSAGPAPPPPDLYG